MQKIHLQTNKAGKNMHQHHCSHQGLTAIVGENYELSKSYYLIVTAKEHFKIYIVKMESHMF
jgi:hypothetical protein